MLATVAAAAEPKIDPLDWPHWRGPEMNGISREKNLPATWDPKKGTNVLWTQKKMGTISSPIVMNGKVYTLARHNPESTKEGEKVICADALTGDVLWENSWNIYLTDAPAERVGWSSVVGDPATGNVYALGLNSVFSCINGETGKTVWRRSLNEECGLLSTYGGRTNIPFLFEDLIVTSGVTTGWGEFAVPAQRFIAFNKLTGEYVWITSTKLRPPDTTYSTPVLAVFKGQVAMVFGSSDGNVYAVQPRTGKVIWTHEASIRGINQTPLVVGSTVFCGFSEEDARDHSVMGGFFAIDGTGTGEIKKRLWNVRALASGRAAPLNIGDKLYATTDNARLFVLDAKTGKQVGRETKFGTISMGSPAYGDGKLYIPEKSGRFYIYEVGDNGLKELSRVIIRNEQFDASPAISHGRVYICSSDAMYCIAASKEPKPAADPRPEVAGEKEFEGLGAAHLQITPVESLIQPGETVKFTAKLFNAHGQFLKDVPAKFTVEGTGGVDDKGVYTAASEAKHTAAIVTAEAEGVKGTARIRIIPPLPWTFDFSDKEIPITWIGARYRHVFREVDGEPMMVKISTIPLGTRSQSWMGPTDLQNYTIQADVRGAVNKENGNLPDIGLINSRYTLDLMGVKQKLQIRSWASRLQLRFAAEKPFAWKGDTWYTLKFQSENKDGAITLRAKAWPRGEEEPAEWLVEGTDATPNTQGSPGTFGMSSFAEIFYDNVKVTPNN